MTIEVKSMQLSSKIYTSKEASGGDKESKETGSDKVDCCSLTSRQETLLKRNMANIKQLFEARRER